MRNSFVALIAVFLTTLFTIPAMGQDVTIRSRDGAIELSGTLLGFDGDFYRLQTDYGELTLDGSGVLCEGPGCPSLTDYVADVTFAGADSLGKTLLPALLESFGARMGYTVTPIPRSAQKMTYEISDQLRIIGRFHVDLSSSADGFAQLIAGQADLVLSMREIRQDEAEHAQEKGLGDLTEVNRSHIIGLNAVVPIVSNRNAIDRISMQHLAEILAGNIQNWQDLGGPDAGITVHLLNPEHGLTQSIEDRLLRPIKANMAEDIEWHEHEDALSNAVSKDPLGLGLVSISAIGSNKGLTLAGGCGFQQQAARHSIKTEDYPLTKPLLLYTPARRLPALVRDFIGHTRTFAAQIAIRRAGFVDQSPETIPIDLQGDRLTNAIAVAQTQEAFATLQDMSKTLQHMQRLTTSFRFEPGSARLDAQSRSNVLQLAEALDIGEYDGQHLHFIGFSDGLGPSSANRDIAQRRANAVRDAVLDQMNTAPENAQFKIDTLGYGQALPMACDDTEWGRQVNRRVEIWIK